MRRIAAAAKPDAPSPKSRLLRLVTIALFCSIQGCGGPPLKPWHTEKLTEEFTAAKADEVRSFDDYKKRF